MNICKIKLPQNFIKILICQIKLLQKIVFCQSAKLLNYCKYFVPSGTLRVLISTKLNSHEITALLLVAYIVNNIKNKTFSIRMYVSLEYTDVEDINMVT